MKRCVLIILIFLMAPTIWAATETIVPDATGTPDDWANFGGANKVTSVTDANDATYIVEVTDEDNQMFPLGNTTFDAGVTVDSFQIVWKHQDNGSGSNKVQLVAFTDASNYCLGANVNLGTGVGTTTDTFLGAPDGANSCGGTLTKAVMDALQIRCDATAIGNSREVRVIKIDVIVYYTEANGEHETARRSRILRGK